MIARHAWRLVRPLQSFAYSSVISSSAAGRYHEAGDRVVYAWSSSEMAFLSLQELTGAHGPAQMVREKLQLPLLPDRIVSLQRGMASGALQAADLKPSGRLCGAMKRAGLLGVWVPSELMPSEHVLVLNPDAPDFAAVAVVGTSTVARGALF